VSQHLFEEAGKVLDMAPKKSWGTKEFAFTKMMLCGECGSGITAEEKHKKLKDGSIRTYVYYRCCHAKDINCKDGSIREDELLERMLEIIDTVDLDQLGMKHKLQDEVSRYEKFTTGVLGQESQQKMPKVEIKMYAKYILKEGKMEEKRELLSCLRSKLVLKSGIISLGETTEK
jgi:hypothetical protein